MELPSLHKTGNIVQLQQPGRAIRWTLTLPWFI